jgi:hypothetical protein
MSKRTRKKPVMTVVELATVQFQPIPEAANFARDRDLWRENSNDLRRVMIFAGNILSKTPEELHQAVSETAANGDLASWGQMLTAFQTMGEKTEGLSVMLKTAHARGCVALAHFAGPAAAVRP